MGTSVDSKEASEQLVRRFCSLWETLDIEGICDCFSEDAVYHNVPVAPIEGKAGVRQIFEAFVQAFKSAKLEVISLAAEPGLVIAERIDYFLMQDGKKVELPVTGVFVIEQGKIKRFSDYFNLADFEQESGLKL